MKYAKSSCFSAVPGENMQTDGFSVDDVAEVLVAVDGYNDGPEWVCIMRLHDGRFARLAAGCDYTGWGCQEDGRAYVAPDLETIYRYGLTDEERARLGVSL